MRVAYAEFERRSEGAFVTELLPSEQSAKVQEGLLDYLTTTFALADQDARLALSEFLEDPVDGLFKGPVPAAAVAVPSG